MFAVSGVTGHVGAATARELLTTGQQVTALVRDVAKGAAWADRGTEVAAVDLADRAGLATTIRGADGFFVLLPFTPATADDDVQRQLADSIAGAVRDSEVPHVVMLSSIGAHLPEGTGAIRYLHYLENRLRETGAVVTIIRSFHFQEKFETVLDAVQGAGTYPNFGESPDTATPMIATKDIGALVAQTLLSPPAATEIVDLDGPSYTEREVAEKLGAFLGTPLQVANIPRADWVRTIEESGVSRHFAEQVAELYDAEERGLLVPLGDRTHRCTTKLEDTIAAALGSGVGLHTA